MTEAALAQALVKLLHDVEVCEEWFAAGAIPVPEHPTRFALQRHMEEARAALAGAQPPQGALTQALARLADAWEVEAGPRGLTEWGKDLRRCAGDLRAALAGAATQDACGSCGGPHPFDTTVPSVVWNRVIRAADLSDYLCLTCIVAAFARAGEGFTAELWGESFHGLPVEFIVASHAAKSAAEIGAENTRLRAALAGAAPTPSLAPEAGEVPLAQRGCAVHAMNCEGSPEWVIYACKRGRDEVHDAASRGASEGSNGAPLPPPETEL